MYQNHNEQFFNNTDAQGQPYQPVAPQYVPYAPRHRSSHRTTIITMFVALAILSGLLIYGAFHNGAHSLGPITKTAKPVCSGFCNTHDLEVDIKATAQQKLDDRLGYGHVGQVFCVPERHLHYRCTVDYTAGGSQDTTILNVTVSPDHQRWIS